MHLKHLVSLSLLSWVSANYTPTTQTLIFDPPLPELISDKIPLRVKVRLASQPSGPVAVTLKAQALKFLTCNLRFTEYDFDIPKDILILPSADISGATPKTLLVNASVCAPGSSFDKTVQTLPIQQYYTTAAVCSATGDPHFSIFRGPQHHYQGLGVHHLVQSDSINIQTDTFRCNSNVACNQGVAIRYQQHALRFALSTSNRRDATLVMTQVSSGTIPEQDIKIHRRSNSNIEITLGDGSVLKLLSYTWSSVGVSYMNVQFALSSGFHPDIKGLCNTITTKGTEYVKADGTLTRDVTQFGKSWAVDDVDNMFMGRINVPIVTPPPLSTLPESCTADVGPCPSVYYPPSPYYTPPSTPSVPGYTPPSYTLPTAPQYSILPVADPIIKLSRRSDDAVSLDQVASRKIGDYRAQCQKLIVSDGCNFIVDRPSFVDSCAMDWLITGSSDAAEAARQAYHAACKLKAELISENGSPSMAAVADKVIAKNGLTDDTVCINDCSGNGKCTDVGCRCFEGFGGNGCVARLK